MATLDPVTLRVNTFYEELPFNYYASDESAAESVRKQNKIAYYPNLDAELKKPGGAKILEVGCGAGWWSNTVAYHYKHPVVGIDLCQRALERARKVADELRISERVRFLHQDLFAIAGEQYSLVNSIGVLHHTPDCKKAFLKTSERVIPGGHFHLGLYHLYGREPFLDIFREERAVLMKEAQPGGPMMDRALSRFGELNKRITDETYLMSWFRDQVLHPHETQHTLEEVCGWLKEAGMVLESTSINRFEPFQDERELFEQEKTYRELSRKRNLEEKTYFPGFFTVMARRPR